MKLGNGRAARLVVVVAALVGAIAAGAAGIVAVGAGVAAGVVAFGASVARLVAFGAGAGAVQAAPSTSTVGPMSRPIKPRRVLKCP